ncbi:MAG: site-2 protease family protein [Gammaproteobacteria bacterium]
MLLLLKIIIFGIPAVLAVTVHEVAHGWVANRLGDPTAAQLGRLSLNPLRHVDPVGTVLVPALVYLSSGFFFGWAKPVPVNWRNLRHLRRDVALVAAAGPLSNLLMLLGWTAVLRAFGDSALIALMSWTGIGFNATIMLLNLLPVPPLDGSRIVTSVLPARLAVRYNRIEPFGLVILVVLLATGVVGAILGPGLAGIDTLVHALLR